ncbi:ATP-binding protein [Aciditerrimonas ferrireducens]|jgi:serine/threonine-protein kinase RsbW|uniref:ATP-binding protein n=1 Tax=Aciditerrimonas ferrireducens TaxID=667306 RepID=UPI0020045D0C|nr:ATP-binding protein [Aciditerrimonas ferrireducens]MCK4176588.1 ATP-binding protein [Aciditerrimonas ferrireducens]
MRGLASQPEPAGDPTDRVVLVLPPRPELLAVARLAAAAVASQAGLSLEEIEDLRLAVDELCSRFLPPAIAAPGDQPGGAPTAPPLRVELRFAPGWLEARCRLEGPPGSVGGPGSRRERVWGGEARALSDRILDALVDEHGADEGGGGAWLRLTHRSGPPS